MTAMRKVESPSPQEINTVMALFRAGRYTEAAALAQKMTVRFPLHGFGWQALSQVYQQMGRIEDALPPMQKAIVLSPGSAELYNYLGVILSDLGQLDEAEAIFQKALRIKPDFAEALNNLGILFRDMGRPADAVASYRQALQIRPDNAEALNNLGVTLKELKRLDEAEFNFRQALQIKADYAEAFYNLGIVLHEQGKFDAALACFQNQLRLTPENAVTQHLIASLTGNTTERAPMQYVENVFDGYADKFDSHLQQELKYAAPEKLVALITRHTKPPAEKWDVLDLGCGTGLVGSAIAPFARQLVGVDLSSKMLKKAHVRNLYQRLERLDLLTMMRGEKDSSYDIVVAADVFVYLGKLDETVSEIKRLLCPGGFVAFSIETIVASSNEEAIQSDQREYQLGNTGRYAHSATYVTKLASAQGFLIQEMEAVQLRTERNKPVNGFLVLWKKMALP